jgi:hypothetical protein
VINQITYELDHIVKDYYPDGSWYQWSNVQTADASGNLTGSITTQWSDEDPIVTPVSGTAPASLYVMQNPLSVAMGGFAYPPSFLQSFLETAGGLIADASAWLTSAYESLSEIPGFELIVDAAQYLPFVGTTIDPIQAASNTFTSVVDTFSNLRGAGYGALDAGALTVFDAIGNFLGTENLANVIDGRNRAGDKLSGLQRTIEGGILGVKVVTTALTVAPVASSIRAAGTSMFSRTAGVSGFVDDLGRGLGGSTTASSKVHQGSGLPKHLHDLAVDVVSGRKSRLEALRDLTPDQLNQMAAFFRRQAMQVKKSVQGAYEFNLARARYLEQGGPRAPGNLGGFLEHIDEFL